jgi:hypothetical protein
MKDVFDKYYRMGTLTIARSRSGDGWVVMENGEQVGGTLLHPFESEAAAQRWVDREKADYQEGLLCGDYEQLACAKVIRQTDAELWSRFADIEEQFRDRDDDKRDAAHRAMGTLIVGVKLARAELEVRGEICRAGYRQGKPTFQLTDQGRRTLCIARFAKNRGDDQMSDEADKAWSSSITSRRPKATAGIGGRTMGSRPVRLLRACSRRRASSR